jgi:type I restriction enzyme S subunit
MITKPLGSLCHVIAGQSPDSSTYNTVGMVCHFSRKADFQEMIPMSGFGATVKNEKRHYQEIFSFRFVLL